MDNNFYNQQSFGFQENFDNKYSEFNPMSQYEQGYMYYRFLTQQLEYKIKCKEFEKISNETISRNERRVC